MKLKTLLTVGLMTLAAGLLPAAVEAAPAAPVTPVNAAAFATGSAVQVAPVVVVRRHRRGYNSHRHGRVVRRVYVDRHGRRHVSVRRVY